MANTVYSAVSVENPMTQPDAKLTYRQDGALVQATVPLFQKIQELKASLQPHQALLAFSVFSRNGNLAIVSLEEGLRQMELAILTETRSGLTSSQLLSSLDHGIMLAGVSITEHQYPVVYRQIERNGRIAPAAYAFNLHGEPIGLGASVELCLQVDSVDAIAKLVETGEFHAFVQKCPQILSHSDVTTVGVHVANCDLRRKLGLCE